MRPLLPVTITGGCVMISPREVHAPSRVDPE
jgi:hypothetical protein